MKEILGRLIVIEAQNNGIWLHGANAGQAYQMLNALADAAADGHFSEGLDTHVIEEGPPQLVLDGILNGIAVAQLDMANDVEATLLQIVDKVDQRAAGARRGDQE